METLRDVFNAKKAAEFRARAEDAKRRAAASGDDKEKAMHLRRKEEFEKLALEAEQK